MQRLLQALHRGLHELSADAARAAGERWRTNPLAEFHWRDWGADSIAFEALSGQICRLEPLSAAVMAYFESHAALSIDELVDATLADLPDADRRMIGESITGIVDQLERRGWIERIPA